MAQVMIGKTLDNLSVSLPPKTPSIFAAFQHPAKTVMTPFKLRDLQLRFRRLQTLIGKENQGNDDDSRKRLARFLILNPHDTRSYAVGLDRLLEELPQDDGLRDNLLLAKALLADDIPRRSQLLEELAERYPQCDAGIQAQYEWGMTKIKLWKGPDASEEEKKKLLIDSHRILSDFIEEHSACPFSEQAREMLQTLPPLPQPQ